MVTPLTHALMIETAGFSETSVHITRLNGVASQETVINLQVMSVFQNNTNFVGKH
jgi:hypothetical protein